jgi:hypothetical protein
VKELLKYKFRVIPPGHSTFGVVVPSDSKEDAIEQIRRRYPDRETRVVFEGVEGYKTGVKK